MTTATTTLTDFLLARIAEDEAVASNAESDFAWQRKQDFGGFTVKVYDHVTCHDPARVLAECEAKRRILVEFFYAADTVRAAPRAAGLEVALCALAFPYAGHPDYRDEWRP